MTMHRFAEQLCRRLRLAAAVVLVAASTPVARCAAPRDLPPRFEEVVDRGFAYLSRQQSGDGTFAVQLRPPPKTAVTADRRTLTAACVLTYCSAGHVPDSGRYGGVVRKAVNALLEEATSQVDLTPESQAVGQSGTVEATGEFPAGDAVVLLALSEVLGVEPSKERRVQMAAAMTTLADRIAHEEASNDLDRACWNVMALRAAQAVGVTVAPETLDRTAKLLTRATSSLPVPDSRPATNPAPALSRNDHSWPLRTVAARLLLASGATVQTPPIDEGLAVEPFIDHAGGRSFLVLALDDGSAARWRSVSDKVLSPLITRQQSDGGWPTTDPRQNRLETTVGSLLALTSAYRLLPVFNNR